MRHRHQIAKSPYPPVEITPRLVLQIAGATGLAPTTIRAHLRGQRWRAPAPVVAAIQGAIATLLGGAS